MHPSTFPDKLYSLLFCVIHAQTSGSIYCRTKYCMQVLPDNISPLKKKKKLIIKKIKLFSPLLGCRLINKKQSDKIHFKMPLNFFPLLLLQINSSYFYTYYPFQGNFLLKGHSLMGYNERSDHFNHFESPF